MFDKLFSRKKDVAGDSTPEDELRLAVAALLVEAARADEHDDYRERRLIDETLSGEFSLSAEEAASLRAQGEQAQAAALDIQRFTRTAKQLPDDRKIAFVERLWEIVLSDAVRDPYEDALIRRICGLIYVEDRESGAARARIEARLNKG